MSVFRFFKDSCGFYLNEISFVNPSPPCSTEVVIDTTPF